MWPGGSAPGASRAVDGTLFSAGNLAGPLWGQSEERLKEKDLTDVCTVTGHSTERLKGWTVLFLGPAGFLPAASVWGAVSPPVRPIKQGYPSLLSPG